MNDIPYGYCHCGCGQKTKLATGTHKRFGWVKGEPLRYIHRHPVTPRKSKLSISYTVTDGGYATPCWIWNNGRNARGYGYLPFHIKGRSRLAHRIIFETLRGMRVQGLDLDHLCRNHACVNPDHLEPVPHRTNLYRGEMTKLLDKDVEAIRASTEHYKVVAERYGINKHYVLSIRRGRDRAIVG